MAQIIITIVYSGKGSLREKVVRDGDLENYRLEVKKERSQNRKPGWAKIISTESAIRGALNITWHQSCKMLTARAITKSGNKPDKLIGDFIAYLLSSYAKSIVSINIMPRK